jgi:hypothetical protein
MACLEELLERRILNGGLIGEMVGGFARFATYLYAGHRFVDHFASCPEPASVHIWGGMIGGSLMFCAGYAVYDLCAYAGIASGMAYHYLRSGRHSGERLFEYRNAPANDASTRASPIPF